MARQDDSVATVLAGLLIRIGAIKFGEFVLSSGARSPIYVDLRIVPSFPDVFRRVLAMLSGLVASEAGDAETIVGVATGGLPWATGVALSLGLPLAYVRSEKKGYGTGRRVEGVVRGCSVIVDDVATTGSSLASAAEAVREAGGRPCYAVVVVDRGQGAGERLSGLGVRLLRLATLREVLEAAGEEGLVERETVLRVIRELYG
ncbi:orotate phosphoribosyltransferase [Pyrofollis japonicus]|uniref:orotate phosphoribosyltransferase n=1 Tax=Pyrofollis japonicus TaxID=3060460 RepID=UPI00295B8B4A|nr:orotate phosphoribosyltransferase [Pyrofollis japonicus]BEP17389.1 orotate phosphoribosyltransferase [Pyrofollis japonicus]